MKKSSLLFIYLFLFFSLKSSASNLYNFGKYSVEVFAEIEVKGDLVYKVVEVKNCRPAAAKVRPKTPLNAKAYTFLDAQGNLIQTLNSNEYSDAAGLHLDSSMHSPKYFLMDGEDTVTTIIFNYVNPRVYREVVAVDEKGNIIRKQISKSFLETNSLKGGVFDILHKDTATCLANFTSWSINGKFVGQLDPTKISINDVLQVQISTIGKCSGSFPCEDSDISEKLVVVEEVTGSQRLSDQSCTIVTINNEEVLLKGECSTIKMTDIYGNAMHTGNRKDLITLIGLPEGIYLIQTSFKVQKIYKW